MPRFEGIPQGYRTASLVALIFAAPLLVGGVHRPAILGLTLAELAFGAAVLLHTEARRRRFEIPAVAWVLLGLIGFTAAQLLPLPPWLLRWVAPDTAELYSFVLDGLPGGLAQQWRPLSLDPAATRLELARMAGLCALLLGVSNTHRRGRSQGPLALAMAAAGALVALVAVAELGYGAEGYLGIYRPLHRWDAAVAHGPFVNPNHLAGFLGLTALVALGLGCDTRQPRGRGAFALALAALAAVGVVLSESRGGILALGVSAALSLPLMLRARRGDPLGRAWKPALLASLLVASVGLVWLDQAAHPLVPGSSLREERKLRSWGAVWDQALANPLTGTGRGAFARAHTRYKQLEDNERFTHAENEPLQALADWGLPVGAAATLGLLLSLLAALSRQEPRPLRLGMAAGLLFLALHNLVDFNLHTLGVALPATIALGIVAQPSRRRSRQRRAPAPEGPDRSSRPNLSLGPRRRWLPASVLAGLALLSLPAWLLDPSAGPAALDALRAARREATLRGPQVEALAARASDLLPAEYLVPTLAAAALLPARSPRPDVPPAQIMRWLNRALYLNPTAPGAHLLTARLLWRTGHEDQALSEYARAAHLGAPPRALVREVVGLGVPAARLLAVLPADEPTLRLLGTTLLAAERWQEAELAFERQADLPLARRLALWRLAEIAGAHREPAEAIARARRLVAEAPDWGNAYWILGRALASAGRSEEALQAWAEATRRDPQQDRAWLARVAALASRGDWLAASECLGEFEPHSHGGPRARAGYLFWRAKLEERWDRRRKAEELFLQAAEADPKDPRPLLHLARLRAAAGELEGAVLAARQALGRAPSPALEQELRDLEARRSAAPGAPGP